MDENLDFNVNTEKYEALMDRFRKRFKYLLFSIKVLGNFAIIYFLLIKDWFNAFILFIIFFPQEVTFIRVTKTLYKSLKVYSAMKIIDAFNQSFESTRSSNNEKRKKDNRQQHHNNTDKSQTEPHIDSKSKK